LTHAIGNVFNVAAFKEGAKLVSVLFDIFRDLGILGLVSLWLCKKQMFHKLLRSWNVERVVQKIVLCHIQEQLATTTFKVALRHHCRLLLFAKLTNDLIAHVLEAYQTLEIQRDSLIERILCILLFIGVEYSAPTYSMR
jgi:hypothetical protein